MLYFIKILFFFKKKSFLKTLLFLFDTVYVSAMSLVGNEK